MKKHKLFNLSLITIGFVLSPLSWWNDLIVNVPLAYLFSAPFSMLNQNLFIPSFILGYYITNLAGFMMLHWGGKGLMGKNIDSSNIKQSLAVSLVYTAVITVIVLIGWLEAPSVYLSQ